LWWKNYWKYREELSRLYSSKFDLIFDHKL